LGTNRYKYRILNTGTMIVNVARYALLLTSLFVAAKVSNTGPGIQQNAPADKQLSIIFAGVCYAAWPSDSSCME